MKAASLWRVLGFPMLLLLATSAMAAPTLKVDVEAAAEVVFCNAELAGETEAIARALKEGTQVTLSWQISIDQVRSYWLDSEIASIQVIHRVVPDLVSGSWRLQDLSSGIERRVLDLNEAVRFLVRLEHFPVIDRSLLMDQTDYRMQVSVEEMQGEEERGWFSRWWGYAEIETAKDFRLR